MFVEERLDLGVDYGTLATITTRTGIIEEGGGAEQRSIGWERPLLKFNLGERGVINDELEYIIEFHRARKGALEGFRFKDWSDWRVKNQLLGYGDGVRTRYQLFKTYRIENHAVNRPIVKPVVGTVKIYVACEIYEDFTVDHATGEVVFAVAPTGWIAADFEFDVPVRFESDEIRLRFEAMEPATGRKLYNREGLSLVEVRVPPAIPLPVDPVPAALDGSIDLGYDYGTIGGNKFETRIDKLVSGHERRSANWQNPKGNWEIGSRSLSIPDLEYLIAFFRVCRGRAIAFRYLDRSGDVFRNVRFGEDAIAFRFDATESERMERAIFNLSGVPLVATGSTATGSTAPLRFIPSRRPDAPGPTILFNTGYGTGWDRPVSNNSYGWNGAGDANSKWLGYPDPAPPKTGDNFDWEILYSFQSNACQNLRARFMVDNQLMSLKLNGLELIAGPIGGFSSGWTEITIPVAIGAIVLSFTVRNVAPGEPNGFQTFNPTGFRLEWL